MRSFWPRSIGGSVRFFLRLIFKVLKVYLATHRTFIQLPAHGSSFCWSRPPKKCDIDEGTKGRSSQPAAFRGNSVRFSRMQLTYQYFWNGANMCRCTLYIVIFFDCMTANMSNHADHWSTSITSSKDFLPFFPTIHQTDRGPQQSSLRLALLLSAMQSAFQWLFSCADARPGKGRSGAWVSPSKTTTQLWTI